MKSKAWWLFKSTLQGSKCTFYGINLEERLILHKREGFNKGNLMASFRSSLISKTMTNTSWIVGREQHSPLFFSKAKAERLSKRNLYFWLRGPHSGYHCGRPLLFCLILSILKTSCKWIMHSMYHAAELIMSNGGFSIISEFSTIFEKCVTTKESVVTFFGYFNAVFSPHYIRRECSHS